MFALARLLGSSEARNALAAVTARSVTLVPGCRSVARASDGWASRCPAVRAAAIRQRPMTSLNATIAGSFQVLGVRCGPARAEGPTNIAGGVYRLLTSWPWR